MNTRAFGAAAHDLVERPGRLADGSHMANGWGVGIVKLLGRVFYHRGGDVEGWTTKVVRERTSGTSVVLATTGSAPACARNGASGRSRGEHLLGGCEEPKPTTAFSLRLFKSAARLRGGVTANDPV